MSFMPSGILLSGAGPPSTVACTASTLTGPLSTDATLSPIGAGPPSTASMSTFNYKHKNKKLVLQLN